MSNSEWVHPEVYREARKQGYTPVQAAYLGRDPVVTLDSDPNVSAWDGGTFDYQGETFTYRIEWDEDCLCREPDSEVSSDEYERFDHRIVTVALALRVESLSSVCGDRSSWLGRLSDDRHIAEVVRDLADEVLSARAAESARLWAEAAR